MPLSILAIPFLILCLCANSYAEQAEKSLSLPPESLANWYKPVNKRQVWLHTMFSLRREMQAVAEYRESKNQPLLEKWAKRLTKNYRRIAEMVPEWQDELDLTVAQQLLTAAKNGQYTKVGKMQRKLGQSCKSCHREFRPTVALLYRSPDFAPIKVTRGSDGAERDYQEVMVELTQLVNRIKIGAEDGQGEVALSTLATLRARLKDLGGSCQSCHKDPQPRERYLEGEVTEALNNLERGIEHNDTKLIGRSLGSAAVLSCARCHSVHRTLSDMRGFVAPH